VSPRSDVHRGEVWWATLEPPNKTRPVVLISREAAYSIRSHVTVAPVTTRIRKVPTLVPVGPRDGLDRDGVVNCDQLSTIRQDQLVERIGALDPSTLSEVDDALRFSLGLD
jgi:mRNA interferase MazF